MPDALDTLDAIREVINQYLSERGTDTADYRLSQIEEILDEWAD